MTLQTAVPFWRRAQAQVEETLGPRGDAGLDGLLDLRRQSSPRLSG